MKNNIRFLIYSLVVTQTIFPSSIQSTTKKISPLTGDAWHSSKQNRVWQKIEDEVSAQYAKSFEIPDCIKDVSIAICNRSGCGVDRCKQTIAFRRFMDALKDKKFESFQEAHGLKTVQVSINDLEDSAYSPLYATVYGHDGVAEIINNI